MSKSGNTPRGSAVRTESVGLMVAKDLANDKPPLLIRWGTGESVGLLVAEALARDDQETRR